MQISESDYQHLISKAIELGMLFYQDQQKKIKISKTQAYKMYGRKTVEYWLEKGLINSTRQGESKNSPVTFSMLELETAQFNQKSYEILLSSTDQ